jgi:hypothetical protein
MAFLTITAGNTEDWWDIPNVVAIDTKKIHVWTWPWKDGQIVHVVCINGEDITCNVEQLGDGPDCVAKIRRLK